MRRLKLRTRQLQKKCLGAAATLCNDLNRRKADLSDDDRRLIVERLRKLIEAHKGDSSVTASLGAYVYALDPEMERFAKKGKPKAVAKKP